MSCEHSDTTVAKVNSSRQSRVRGSVFSVIGLALLIAGVIVSPDLHAIVLLVATFAGWNLVQLVAAGYIRTQPRHIIGLPLVAAVATVLALFGLSFLASNWGHSLVIAGTWTTLVAVSEVFRGQRWRRALDAQTEEGDVVRSLAVWVGYDGLHPIAFGVQTLLVLAWAFLFPVMWWILPLALLIHATAALGLVRLESPR